MKYPKFIFLNKGIFCFLPFEKCNEIAFKIKKAINDKDNLISLIEEDDDGYIKHLFYGLFNEYCTKVNNSHIL